MRVPAPQCRRLSCQNGPIHARLGATSGSITVFDESYRHFRDLLS